MEIIVIVCSIVMSLFLMANLYVHIKRNHVYVVIHSTFGVISVTDELGLSEDIINLYYLPDKVAITEIDSCPYFPELNGKPMKYFKVYGRYENISDGTEDFYNDYLVVLKVYFEELI